MHNAVICFKGCTGECLCSPGAIMSLYGLFSAVKIVELLQTNLES